MEIVRLRRELQHVGEQLVVEHRMTLDWRTKYQEVDKERPARKGC